MKKLICIVLALVMLLAASITAFADFAEFENEPTSYLWLKTGSAVPNVTFKIPGSRIPTTGDITLTAKVCFCEDIVQTEDDGLAYVNCYSYADEDKYNNFDYLIAYADFADSRAYTGDEEESEPVLGKWIEFAYTFDPHFADYASGNPNTAVAIVDGMAVPEMVTVGIGFWHATGTLKVANVTARANNELIWAVDFSGGFDVNDPDTAANLIVAANMSEEQREDTWGTVAPVEVVTGVNLSEGKTCTIVGGNNEGDPKRVGGNDTYCTSLTDGVASPDEEYSSKWFGFLSNKNGARDNAVTLTDDEGEYRVGKAVVDLGESVTFDCVRAHCWSAGVSGIGFFRAIEVFYSDDNADWQYAGSLTLGNKGEVYWAESTEDLGAHTARYVMVEFDYVNGVWGFINEIQVIYNGTPLPKPDDPVALADFDGDGQVTSDDAVFLLRSVLFPERYVITLSNPFFGSGDPTSDDAVYLLRYVLFPERYPLADG